MGCEQRAEAEIAIIFSYFGSKCLTSPLLKIVHSLIEEKGQAQMRAEILALWWRNPSRRLTLSHVLDDFLVSDSSKEEVLEMAENIREIMISLEQIGLINTPLLAPTPSRSE